MLNASRFNTKLVEVEATHENVVWELDATKLLLNPFQTLVDTLSDGEKLVPALLLTLQVNDVPDAGEAQVWNSKDTEYVSPATVSIVCARVIEPEPGMSTSKQYVLTPQPLLYSWIAAPVLVTVQGGRVRESKVGFWMRLTPQVGVGVTVAVTVATSVVVTDAVASAVTVAVAVAVTSTSWSIVTTAVTWTVVVAVVVIVDTSVIIEVTSTVAVPVIFAVTSAVSVIVEVTATPVASVTVLVLVAVGRVTVSDTVAVSRHQHASRNSPAGYDANKPETSPAAFLLNTDCAAAPAVTVTVAVSRSVAVWVVVMVAVFVRVEVTVSVMSWVEVTGMV